MEQILKICHSMPPTARSQAKYVSQINPWGESQARAMNKWEYIKHQICAKYDCHNNIQGHHGCSKTIALMVTHSITKPISGKWDRIEHAEGPTRIFINCYCKCAHSIHGFFALNIKWYKHSIQYKCEIMYKWWAWYIVCLLAHIL